MKQYIKPITQTLHTKKHDLLLRQNLTAAEVGLRKADQDYGYAEGINHVLVSLGFKHEDMRVLGELLQEF